MDLSGYDLATLHHDEEFVLCRGRAMASPTTDALSVLVRMPASEHPGPDRVRILEHEFALRSELDSTWAVRPLALAQHQGRAALVLEDAHGEPLARLLEAPAIRRRLGARRSAEPGMELRLFLTLAVGLTSALGEVHRRGIIHKNVKPAHVLVNAATGEVWLTGFGIASRIPRERQAPGPAETIVGSLAYMAPEQTGRMNRSIDTRSDLYALGVTLYEMLTGSLPFTAADPMEWVHCHIARQAIPPSERVKHVPKPLSAIIMKLLAKTAEERYQTAAGLERDLRRCLTQFDADRCIDDFVLGERDTPDRLLIPQTLYGREREIEILLAAFDRIIQGGAPELVLVSGYSGIGKSAVVNELHKVLVPPRGLFAAGKFDQYKRDIPYSTLAQAFQSLVRQVLSKDAEEISVWRDLFLEALGTNGQLLTNLIPELELIIGEQPPVPVLSPQEGQNRFQRVFRRFLGVFARSQHPLALFLDDLQWLDIATLELLQHLATHPEVKHLLLVGAYRDNEVDPAHPLKRILAAIGGAGGRVEEIALAPLAPDDVVQMVADSLHCAEETAQPLAHLIHEKTGGNPFFAIQFFTALTEEDLLQFDHRTMAWTWDVARIRTKGFSENVIDLMAAKLDRLSSATRNALAQLACLGNVAQVATMVLVRDGPEEQLHTDLWEALLAGLVFRTNGGYKFLHDRVHEAAYGLILDSERATAHLRIGRILMARTAPESLEDAIFDIVGHFNRGAALIEATEERDRVIALNLRAGKRARNATAYASARNFLAQAAQLLPPDAWTRRYTETFELYLLLSECEYLVGNFGAADALFDLILRMAASDIDGAKVHSLRMKLYQVAGKYDEALAVALNALRHFGVNFPDADKDIGAAIEVQLRDVPNNLAGRSIGALLEAPVAADSVKRAIIDLLVDTAPGAYIARPSLFPLVALEAVNRSMRDGNTDQSSYAYAVYALMLVSSVGDMDSAFQFSEMSLRLNERFNNPRLRGTLLHLHGDHVNFWRRHFATGLPVLQQAFAACLEVGDLVYAGFLAFETVWQVIEKGDSLDDVLDVSTKYASFAEQSHNLAVYETIRLEQRFIASLQGRTADSLSFSDDSFDETACLAAIAKAAFGCGIVFHHIMKQMIAVLYGRYPEALQAASNAEPVLGAAMAMPIEATHHFFHALTLTALYPQATAVEQVVHRQTLDLKLQKLRLWAHSCPENYGNRYALVCAEIARIEGRDIDAMRQYEEAIRSAHDNDFVQNEALANELAGKFYLALGLETSGHAHLRNARACYAHWGAHGKVRDLDHRYPHLRTQAPVTVPTDTIGAPLEQLDLVTVIKVSQAVSGEMVLDKLLDTLMRAAIEHAGAERALLMLSRNTEQRIAAEAITGNADVIVRLCDDPVTGSMLPETVMRYVLHTRETVIVEDAAVLNPFSADAYFAERRARSVLCLPLTNQAKLIGVLYLENSLAPRVFAPAPTAVLKLLASQAAISLENSRLYRDVAEREARIRRLVDANIIGILIWKLDGRIIDANDAFLAMVGYDRDDLVARGLHWTDLTPPEWRDRDAQLVREIKIGGTLRPFEKEYFRKDGRRVPVLVGAALFEGSSDEGVAFVVDLSERKLAEEALNKARSELAHVARVTTLNTLTASIAHEINQPLSGIITNADACLMMLEANPPDVDGARETARRMIRDGNRSAAVVTRLRALFSKREFTLESLDLNEATREVLALSSSDLQRNRVIVQTELADDLPTIIGDRIQLQQVILNLLRNASDAMASVYDRPRLALVRTEREHGDRVRVTVRDAGTGFDRPRTDSLFDAFYTTKSDGMGIGLSISRSIVERHHGRLWAAPNDGPGATFSFSIPRAPRERHVDGSCHEPSVMESNV
jgi:PAS domain S-box-containing protein